MGHRDASSQEAFFNCLYEERFSKMKRYALILLSNPELAEEVVQDAFLELYLHIDEVMAHEKPEFWLQKAVKYNVVIPFSKPFESPENGTALSIK